MASVELLVRARNSASAEHCSRHAAGAGAYGDASSVTSAWFRNYAAQLTLHKDLLEKLALTLEAGADLAGGLTVCQLSAYRAAGCAHCYAVYIPGRHAPMQDLLKSLGRGRLLADFHQRNKTTALVCHGPIG